MVEHFVTDKTGFAARLLQARKNAGLSQRALAFPGCSPVMISLMEHGERLPSLQVAEVLADRLGVSVSWLTKGKEDPLFLACRAVVEEVLSGFEVPEEIIDRLDYLTLPTWWWDYIEWKQKGEGERPGHVPEPLPAWAATYEGLLRAKLTRPRKRTRASKA